MKTLLIALCLLASCHVTAQTTNPAVMQENLKSTVCARGWSASVRPTVKYTNAIKRRLMAQAGVSYAERSNYELDHLIPIGMGGASKDPANLSLQPWGGPTGARAKDVVELRMHRLVCSERVTLAAGQACFRDNWMKCP